jgi:hypothetical protein
MMRRHPHDSQRRSRTARRLAAADEIRQLPYRYAYAADFRDVDLFRSLWAPARTPAQPPEIDIHTVEKLIEEWPRRGPSILFVCNHLLEFQSDDRARGTVYCIVQGAFGERFIDQSILYQDRYVRLRGRWLFSTRRHLMWFGQERATHPLEQPPANWPEAYSGRGTLPEDYETYRRFREMVEAGKTAPVQP